MPDTFLQAVERRLKPKVFDYSKHERAFGYPVIPVDQYHDTIGYNLADYAKQNPNVAGMAMGAGLNDSEELAPRTIVVNPDNPYMKDPKKRDALLMIEAARHMMEEEKYDPAFPITPEMKKWREETFTNNEGYRNNDKAFKQSLVSRILVGDAGTEVASTEALADAERFRKALLARK